MLTVAAEHARVLGELGAEPQLIAILLGGPHRLVAGRLVPALVREVLTPKEWRHEAGRRWRWR